MNFLRRKMSKNKMYRLAITLALMAIIFAVASVALAAVGANENIDHNEPPADPVTTTTTAKPRITTTTTTTAPPPPPEPVYEPTPEPAYEPAPEPVYEPTPEPVYEAPPVEPQAAAGLPPDSYWDQMAICETGGNWAHFPDGTWTGGLGIYNQTWVGWGGLEFAPKAGQATREQQIIVANRIATQGYNGLGPVGYSAWGCLPQVGYP